MLNQKFSNYSDFEAPICGIRERQRTKSMWKNW